VGDPDLSSPSERPRGLVIFPAADGVSARHQAAGHEPDWSAGGAAWLAQWRVFIVTLVVGACVVVAIALILGARTSSPAAPALPPPAPSANPGSGPHP
jgi:hypothetical protein